MLVDIGVIADSPFSDDVDEVTDKLADADNDEDDVVVINDEDIVVADSDEDDVREELKLLLLLFIEFGCSDVIKLDVVIVFVAAVSKYVV